MASKRSLRSGRACRRIGHRLVKGRCVRCRMEFSHMPPFGSNLSISDAYKKGYITLEDQIAMLSGLRRREKPPYDRHPKRDNHYKLCRRICEDEVLPAKVRFTNWIKDQMENHGLVDMKTVRSPTASSDEEAFCEEMIAINAAVFFGETKPWSDTARHVKVKCPQCKEQHVDTDEWVTTRKHKKHLCLKCGSTWTPNPVAYTVGVA